MINLEQLSFDWALVGSVPSTDLIDARNQIHHAVQLIAAAGKSLIPERPDDSHTSLHWNEDQSAFEGETIGGASTFQVGLSPADMTLYIKQHNQDELDTYALNGNTLNSALSWLKAEIEKRNLEASKISFKMHYEIPPHHVAEGNVISIDNPNHFVEIGQYFSNANNVLHAIKTTLPETSDIRCWPHHFDIASLITIDTDKSAEGGAIDWHWDVPR